MTNERQILSSEQFGRICTFIRNYRGLPIECEWEMIYTEFPDVSMLTLCHIIQKESWGKKCFSLRYTPSSSLEYREMALRYLLEYEKKQRCEKGNKNILLDMARTESVSPILLCRCILHAKSHFTARESSLMDVEMFFLEQKYEYTNKELEWQMELNVGRCVLFDNIKGKYNRQMRSDIRRYYETKLQEKSLKAGLQLLHVVDHHKCCECSVTQLMLTSPLPGVLKIIDVPCTLDNVEIYWIAGITDFASIHQHNHYVKIRLRRYVQKYGPGLVIYWLGYEESVPLLPGNPAGLIVLDTFPSSERLYVPFPVPFMDDEDDDAVADADADYTSSSDEEEYNDAYDDDDDDEAGYSYKRLLKDNRNDDGDGDGDGNNCDDGEKAQYPYEGDDEDDESDYGFALAKFLSKNKQEKLANGGQYRMLRDDDKRRGKKEERSQTINKLVKRLAKVEKISRESEADRKVTNNVLLEAIHSIHMFSFMASRTEIN